jgi:hypothetical protein
MVVVHDLRNAKHTPSRDKSCLLLIGETKIDLAENQQMGPSYLVGKG